jgi:integrase
MGLVVVRRLRVLLLRVLRVLLLRVLQAVRFLWVGCRRCCLRLVRGRWLGRCRRRSSRVRGLRRGELFALTWADIDFEKRMIRVHATNHRARIEESTKTEAGERFVPLFDSARKVLAARKLRCEYNQPVDFVFGNSVGTAMDPGNFVRREFLPARKKAGLPSFRWHDLRHFAVSALIEQRTDIKLIQAVAGHSSATITPDVYGHLMNERVSEAAILYDPLASRQTGR